MTTIDERKGVWLWDGSKFVKGLAESTINPNVRVAIYQGSIPSDIQAGAGDGQDNAKNGLWVAGRGHLFNGASWDRARNNFEVTLLASALRTGNVITPNQVNYNARGGIAFLNVTARTVGVAPSLRLDLQALDPVSGAVEDMDNGGAFNPTVGLHFVVIYPTVVDANGAIKDKVNVALPRIWRLEMVPVADITDLTYSLGWSYTL